jgi:RNA polymerase sigma factor (sigma-70 family)
MFADLMTRAREGDRDALVTLLNSHDAEIRAVVERRLPADCRPLLAADDVLQETYFDAVQGIQHFAPRDDRSFAAWLTCIAVRKLALATRALRAAKRRGNGARVLTSAPDSEQTLLENLTQLATHSTPSSFLTRDEALAQLRSAIAILPPHYQTVIRRYDLEGAAMGEIAVEIGRTVGAAYLLRLRAHEALRSFLAGQISKF